VREPDPGSGGDPAVHQHGDADRGIVTEARQAGGGHDHGEHRSGAGEGAGVLTGRRKARLAGGPPVVVGTGVDPVTFRFSGGRSAN
jgi:hypothetical protein